MDPWSDIRLAARDCRNAALANGGSAPTARKLVEATADLNDLEIVEFDPGTRAGDNVLGFFERGPGIVHVARGQAQEDEVVVIAHELGHFRLHKDPESNVTDVSMRLSGEPVESGGARVDGYSSRERKEVQADVFAGEFLCPSDWLRDELLAGARPSAIAAQLGLPRNLVLQQAKRDPLQFRCSSQLRDWRREGAPVQSEAAWCDGHSRSPAGQAPAHRQAAAHQPG